MIEPQHSTQDGPPEDLLAKLRERLDYRWREVTEESAIDPAVVLERGYYLENTKAGLKRIGFGRSQQRAPALVIPRFNPSGESIPPQIKPDNPHVEEHNGKSRPRKYETPAGTGVRLSVPPRAVPMMRDVQKPLYITEGDKKADALASVGECCISLQGVECWRVPQDWEEVKLYRREVVIAFDADVMVNPNVQKALQDLAAFLQERGALVKYLLWPERYRGTKTGIDDYLADGGTIVDLYWTAREYPDIEAIPVGIMLSEVQAESVEWLWERRIPLGKITVLDGDPGLGKSVLTTDLAARLTTGRAMPDGFQKREPAGVVILSAEDGAGDTIRPRFDAASGDPEKVVLLGTEELLGIPEDLGTIERAIKQVDAELVIIDPIMAFMGEEVNPNSDKEVRRALTPVKQLAERLGVAVLIVRHLNKTPGGNHLYRGGGSIGIIGAARVGLLVGPHPDDEDLRVLAGQKSNLGPPPESLKYRIETAENDSARVKYEGTVEMKPQDLLKAPQDEEERSAADEARDFLRSVLAGGVRKESNSVKAEAKSLGISETTLNRVKRSIGVKSMKIGDTWFMSLSDDVAEGEGATDSTSASRQPTDDHLDHLGNLPFGGKNSGNAGKMVIDDNLGNLPSDAASTTTTNGGKKAYLSEDGQDGQGSHDPLDALQPVVANVACQGPEEGGQDSQDTTVDHLPYAHVTTEVELAPLLDELRLTEGAVALDTETFDPNLGPQDKVEDGDALDVRVAQVRLIQVKTEDGSPWVIDAKSVGTAPLFEALRGKTLIMHNAAYDLAVLRTNFGYVHDGSVSDTMLAAQVFYAGKFNLDASLQGLLEKLLEVKISKEEQATHWGVDSLSDAQLAYAAADVEHLHELAEVLRRRVRKSAGLEDVVNLENEMVKVVAEMGALGMPIDQEIFAECVSKSEAAIAEQLAKLDGLITAPTPEDFITKNTKNKNVPEERNNLINWNSPQQSLWAFKSAGLCLPNTNKKVLAEYEGNPLADALRTLREVGDVAKRFRNTKVENGRVHAKWKQVEAETGRMACEKPPLQGIPKPLRRAFTAPAGHKLIVSDLSQIEVRVLCALSGDENLRQEFINGFDIHRAVAANVLGIPREDVTAEQRKLAKGLVFGLVYGQGLKGFADKAREVFKKNYTEAEVEAKFWKPFFEAYPSVARWRKNAIARFDRGRRDSYTKMGRRRLNLENSRQALNTPIQGGAADVMKAIAVAVYERRLEVPGLEIVGLVHDEILATVPEEHAAAAATLVHEVMQEVGEEATNVGVDEDKRVPVDAGTQICDSWAEKE
jgi:DNA polymerase I-like protein with 3'-5' exonuclease and polymerase domains